MVSDSEPNAMCWGCGRGARKGVPFSGALLFEQLVSGEACELDLGLNPSIKSNSLPGAAEMLCRRGLAAAIAPADVAELTPKSDPLEPARSHKRPLPKKGEK